ncbi:hypothetical protein NQ317_018874 [Molorchus minor]|uniref:Reverse transcriptase domain-containing protein n=1 Tax=Molorchus minor TaxID=1323400 RepID=A0ABQ9IQ27_9CUCU|nr:hypothetical protein NQ317_018874 [Molorchus minor]
MEDARTATRLIRQNTYMASLDLQDAYYLLPIHEDDRKYLRFLFEGQLYEFTCLPFGLASAPYAFTKLLKPLVQYLRSRGVTCINYLDDFLFLGDSKNECGNNIQLAVELLSSLGFLINSQKSMLTPNTRCKFLGFIFDSIKMSIELPLEKWEKILRWIHYFKKRTVCTIQKLARFIGIVTSACPAVKYGWAHTKLFERAKYLALKRSRGNYRSNMSIPQNLFEDKGHKNATNKQYNDLKK